MTKQEFDPNGLAGRSSFVGLHPFAIWYDTSAAPIVTLKFNSGRGRYITLGQFIDGDPAGTFKLSASLLTSQGDDTPNIAFDFDAETCVLSLTDSTSTTLNVDLKSLAPRHSFERTSQNLNSWNSIVDRDDDGSLRSIAYSDGSQTIEKTLNRDADGALSSIVLSGDTASGIALTKTIHRDANGAFAGASYS